MAEAAADAAPAPKSKKLIIIIAAVLVLVLAGGGGALFIMKKNADKAKAEESDAEDTHTPAKAAVHVDPKAKPEFVKLDDFTVNLADRQADRYAQIMVQLEVQDPKAAEMVKNFMPKVRNNILLVLSRKTADDLISYEGKLKLAKEIQRETLLAMGIEMEEEEEEEPPQTDKGTKKKKKRKVIPDYPVRSVLFEKVIIQ